MENIALVTIKIPQHQPHPVGAAHENEMPTAAPKQTRLPERFRPSSQPGTTVSKSESAPVQPPTLGVKFFSAGTAACVADMITFPLDTAKVRLQIQGEGSLLTTAARGGLAEAASIAALKYRGMLGTLATISKEEGPRALYNGLVPGLQRQMAFASIRIGLYDTVKQFYLDIFQANGTVSGNNVGLRILAGITTGAAAVTCAQPTDVVKVRMQAAGKGPKRYSGCVNAYRTIGAQEGIRGLWRGTLPNVTRNAIVNAAELVSYDLIKEAIIKHNILGDAMPCHFLSAFGAGFCTTVIASPVDVVKTRFMNSSKGTYTGAMHCAASMYREGGLKAFYKGFIPSYMRLGSWNIVMFVTFEQFKKFFMDIRSKSDNISVPLPDVTMQSAASVKKYM